MIGNYPLHLMILVLLWGYIYTSWSLMGRLGLVSFGHGAFMGIGAYTVVMLWNHFGWSPWAGGLWVWRAVDRSMARLALQAISEEEEAAASIGIHVTRAKLRITLISALMTCAGGVLYAQYQLYVNPETVSGIGISLQMVFGAIAGGMFVMLGPTVGAAFTLLLAEGLRLAFGNRYPALDSTLYGAMLVLFIIYMPKGILGAALEALRARTARPTAPRSSSGMPSA